MASLQDDHIVAIDKVDEAVLVDDPVGTSCQPARSCFGSPLPGNRLAYDPRRRRLIRNVWGTLFNHFGPERQLDGCPIRAWCEGWLCQ